MAAPWTTTPRQVWPPAADNLVVTPNAVAFANSAWVEAVAATSTACLLAGVVVSPGAASVDYEVEVGTGPAGAETGIATLIGQTASSLTGLAQPALLLPLPIDNIASGARVAVRLRKLGTSVTTWTVAVLYYAKPTTGTLQTTTKPSKSLPAAVASGVCTSGTGLWANGAYVTLTASAAADLVLLAVSVMVDFSNWRWEVDLAIGAAAAEVVITTVRGYSHLGVESPNLVLLPTPLDAIPSGSRVSARCRRDDGTNTVARTVRVRLLVLEKPL